MLLIPYLMAAVRMYAEGFASREDIDAGMKLGCGHPMGPLTLCDFIGLDVVYAISNSLLEEFNAHEYAPPPLLKRMVASGRLGRKSGRGFYEYGSSIRLCAAACCSQSCPDERRITNVSGRSIRCPLRDRGLQQQPGLQSMTPMTTSSEQ